MYLRKIALQGVKFHNVYLVTTNQLLCEQAIDIRVLTTDLSFSNELNQFNDTSKSNL